MDELSAILKGFNRCKELDSLELQEKIALARHCRVVHFKEGEQVFTVSHKGRSLYVVLRGTLSLRLKSNKYREFRRGELFGEMAVYSDLFRLGTIHCLDDARLVEIDREVLLGDEALPPVLRLKITTALLRKVIGYSHEDTLLSSKELIGRGESEMVAFRGIPQVELPEPIVHTIAAFMNLQGGAIFVGVDGAGEILGLDFTKTSMDQFQVDVLGEVKERLGQFFATLISFDVEEINQKLIIRIDVDSSNSPVFLKAEGEYGQDKDFFVVRTGTTNTTIDRSDDIVEYVQRRFKI